MKNMMEGERPSFNCPKSIQSQSEIKPPTINSSFVQNFHSYQDWGTPYPNAKALSLTQIKDDHYKSIIQNSSSFRKINKKLLKTTKPQTVLFDDQLDGKIRKNVTKFIEVLIRQAYVYKETLFNNFQKTILLEKYLQSDHKEFQNKGHYFQVYHIVWDLLYIIFIINLLFQLPLQLGFSQENTTLSLIFISIIIIDLAIQYHLSNFRERNQQFRFSQLNKVDVTNFISISLLVGCNIFNQGTIIIAHIISFVCSLIKFQKALEKYSIYFSFSLSHSIFICKLIFAIHFSACFWLHLGRNDDQSWIQNSHLLEVDDFTKYCHSLYWSTATLLNIGQSQINATTKFELLYSSLIMLLSAWVLASLIVASHNIFKEKNEEYQLRNLLLPKINQFLKSRKLSSLLINKIRDHFSKNSKDQNQLHLGQIISKLPKNLGQELNFQVGAQALQKCQFLTMFSDNVKMKLVNLMEFKSFHKNEVLSKAEQLLYMIDYGQVEVIEYDQIVCTFGAGDCFGEFNFVSGETCTSSYKIAENSGIFQIKFSDFIQVIKQHQIDYEKFTYLKDQLLNRKYQVLNMKCYSCQSYSHLIKDCDIINYKPNLMRLISKYNKKIQNRASFVRNQNQRRNNQVLKKLSVRIYLIQFKLNDIELGQSKMVYPDDSSEEHITDEVTDQIFEELTDQMQSNLSYKKYNDSKKEGQNSYLFSISKVTQNYDTIMDIQKSIKEKTNCTAQYQNDKEYRQYLPPQSQKLSNKASQFKYFERKKSGNSMSQSEQISQSGPLNEVLSQRKNIKKQSIGNQKQILQNDSIESLNAFLPKIQEEDSFLINPALYKQEDFLMPKLERFSQSSLISKNTQTNQQSRQSSRKCSSKLSSIQYNSSEFANPPKQKLSSFAKNQFSLLPIAKEIVDLSLLPNRQFPKEEFETMHTFTVYYPSWNHSVVIFQINKFLNWKQYQKDKLSS